MENQKIYPTNISKDILVKLALELDNVTLLNFCKSSKRFDELTCKSNLFWFYKLNKDYNTNTAYDKSIDYRNSYKMIIDKKTFYQVLKSYCDDEIQAPKFWPYIRKTIKKPNGYMEDISQEVYDDLAKKYPDLMERCGEEFIFEMNHNYPEGTKIYLAYSDDRDLGLKQAFINKGKAVEKILALIKLFLQYFIQDHREEYTNFYGNKSVEEILEDFKNQLLEQGHFKFYSPDTNQFYWYVLQEFTL